MLDFCEVSKEQASCDWIKTIGSKEELIERKFNEFTLIFDKKHRFVVPQSLQLEFLESLHTYLEHPGENSFYLTIRRIFRFQGFKEKIKKVIYNCLKCQQNKNHRNRYGIQPGGIDSKSFLDLVTLDYFGSIQTTKFSNIEADKKFFVLVMTDVFTKWTEVKVTTCISAKNTCAAVKEIWLDRVGLPERFHSDRGTQFVSKEFRKLCANNNIKTSLTSPYSPTSNSVTERQNSIVAYVLRNNKGSDYYDLENKISRRLNFCSGTLLKLSPYELRFKNRPINMFGLPSEIKIEASLAKAKETRENKRKQWNSRRIPFEVTNHDLVFIKNRNSDKLAKKWIGPLQISKRLKAGQIEVEYKGKIVTVGYRDYRPFLEDGRMSCTEYDHF